MRRLNFHSARPEQAHFDRTFGAGRLRRPRERIRVRFAGRAAVRRTAAVSAIDPACGGRHQSGMGARWWPFLATSHRRRELPHQLQRRWTDMGPEREYGHPRFLRCNQRALPSAGVHHRRPERSDPPGVDHRVHALLATDISGETPEPGEQPTQFNFTFPVSYRIDDNLRLVVRLRLGTQRSTAERMVERPRARPDSFFVALDWRTGTEKTRGGWP